MLSVKKKNFENMDKKTHPSKRITKSLVLPYVQIPILPFKSFTLYRKHFSRPLECSLKI